MIAWGKHVDSATLIKVRALAQDLGCEPGDILSCMAFETGRTFSPSIRSAAGSGATGLIQFMPQTAAALGTTTDALANMSQSRQMDFVAKYFRPWNGRLRNLGDVYLAILWPAGVGKPDTAVIFAKGGDRPKLYLQNAGLDANKDGAITRGEIIAKIVAMKAEGLKPGNAL